MSTTSLSPLRHRRGGLAAITDGTPTLLDGMDAGGAALYHRDRWWRVGATPTEAQLDALGDWLASRSEFFAGARTHYATDCLVREYPPGAAFADVASGLLAVPLLRNGRNLMLWFRPETIRTVRWGETRTTSRLSPARTAPGSLRGQASSCFRSRSGAIATVEVGGAGGRRPAATPGDGAGRQPGRASRHPEL